MPVITATNLTVQYKNAKQTVAALNQLDVTFEPNAFNVIVGCSGCGKTTLLRALAGQLAYEGQILFDDTDVKRVDVQKRNMAFVSQQFVLYSNKTIFDNIAFPLKIKGVSKNEIITTVRDVADKLDLTACLTRKPRYLSGGQQQRVALAKALVKKPSICLLDEPFSNVDAKQRINSRILVKKALSQYDCTVIYVTHDFREAMALADKLFVMDDGKIVICGKPLDVFNSDNELVNSFKEQHNGGENV